MRRTIELIVILGLCLGVCLGLGGCFQADVDALLFDDGAGKFDIFLSVHRSKLPLLLGDPLAGVGEVEDLRRYTSSGIVAWSEPQRTEADGWERVHLTAFFDDINAVRFLRLRDAAVVELLGFDYDNRARPGHLGMRVDMEPELAAPFPLPEREGLELSPDVLRQLVGMLRPMLGDLRLSLSFEAPAQLTRASGFRQLEERTARLVADRDVVLSALQEQSGALLDVDALLGADAAIEWDAAVKTLPLKRQRFDLERQVAREWWKANNTR
ncbi:MAG TPA: hypothetical protein VGB13_02480 [Candidatus Krumholzibacteria bacterium]|jgi:hypothetical protein